MTKEAILDNIDKARYRKDTGEAKPVGYLDVLRDVALDAMSEYAKEQAMAFAIYIGNINIGKIQMPKNERTWEELYPLFLEYQSQQPTT